MNSDLLENQSKDDLLNSVREQTGKIKKLQEEIVETAEGRRKHVLALRKQNVTYREIAETISMSEVTVYKIIRGK
jgi:DNA-directed RNA polymerase specialized sigma subunit